MSRQQSVRRALGALTGVALAAVAVVPSLATNASAPVPTVDPPVGEVVFEEDFEGVLGANGLPEGWTSVDGDWRVEDGRLLGTSSSSGQLARVTFGPHVRDVSVEATIRFDAVAEPSRWGGMILDIAPGGGVPWSQAIMRSGSTASNGVEFAQRTAANAWNVTDAGSAPTAAGVGRDVDVRIDVRGSRGVWYFDGVQVLTTANVARSQAGVLGFVVSGGTLSIADVVVTELEPLDTPIAPVLPDGAIPVTVAHRGYSAIAPENTLAAVVAAVRARAEFIEIDALVSADGVPVLMHDSTVGRTTNGTGAVRSLTLAELKELDAGSWFHPAFAGEPVPTLGEALDVIDGTGSTLLLEVKGPMSAGEVAAIVDDVIERDMADQVLLQSFDTNVLGVAAQLDPSIPLGLLRGALDLDPVAVATDMGVVAYNPNADALLARPGVVDDLNEAGIAVMPYTVNDVTRWERLADIGVDGVITDRAGAHVGWREGAERRDDPPPAGALRVSWPLDGATFARVDSVPVLVDATNADDVVVTLDGAAIGNGEALDLRLLDAGEHVVVATATGADGAELSASATFSIVVDLASVRVSIAELDVAENTRALLFRALDGERWQVAQTTLRRAGLPPEIEARIAADIDILAAG